MGKRYSNYNRRPDNVVGAIVCSAYVGVLAFFIVMAVIKS